MNEEHDDVSRRTRLAAERTWLAWWRTGLAVSIAAIGVGRVAPDALHHSRTAYAVVGVGYGLLAITMFVLSRRRYNAVRDSLSRGTYEELSTGWVAALAWSGALLALATLALILA